MWFLIIYCTINIMFYLILWLKFIKLLFTTAFCLASVMHEVGTDSIWCGSNDVLWKWYVLGVVPKILSSLLKKVPLEVKTIGGYVLLVAVGARLLGRYNKMVALTMLAISLLFGFRHYSMFIDSDIEKWKQWRDKDIGFCVVIKEMVSQRCNSRGYVFVYDLNMRDFLSLILYNFFV